MAEQNFDLPPGTDSVSTIRSKVNDALKALRGCFWGTAAPGASLRAAFQMWADTTNAMLKQRNTADSAWVPWWPPDEGPRYQSVVRMCDQKLTHLMLAAPFDLTVKRAWLVCEIATSGSSGANNYAYQVRNRTTAVNLAATAKTTVVEELAANTRWLVTTDQNLDVNEGAVIDLLVTVTGTPTSLTGKDLIVGIEYVRRSA